MEELENRTEVVNLKSDNEVSHLHTFESHTNPSTYADRNSTREEEKEFGCEVDIVLLNKVVTNKINKKLFNKITFSQAKNPFFT